MVSLDWTLKVYKKGFFFSDEMGYEAYFPLKRQTTDLFAHGILFFLLYLKTLKFRWCPGGGRRYSCYLYVMSKRKIESPTPNFSLLEILKLEKIFN